jgi:hypothetical protein
MIAINHFILADLIFPATYMGDLITLYETYVDAGCGSSGLHLVLRQIFASSNDAKAVALDRGFPLLALRELQGASESEEYFDRILLLCAQFVDGFPDGQREIFEQWSLETLIGIFHPLGQTLPFFLALSALNPEVKAMFALEINSESLLSKILECFEIAKYADSTLIQLLAAILNAMSVRQIVCRKQKLKSFVGRLTAAISAKDWEIAEAMLRVFATFTFYGDAIDKLFGVINVPELIVTLSENDTIWKSPFVDIFLRNLKSHAKFWCGLAGALNKENPKLMESLKTRVPDL